jgi:hypothetical protein
MLWRGLMQEFVGCKRGISGGWCISGGAFQGLLVVWSRGGSN